MKLKKLQEYNVKLCLIVHLIAVGTVIYPKNPFLGIPKNS